MKTIGIICEYNPLHGGHIRHINESRALAGGDCSVVCVLSGNFVQRGDFAVFGKHARAAAAVACGADLVLELPLPYILSSAERFARGGVELLNALGVVTHLSFGSEAGELEPLLEAAGCLVTESLPGLVADELKTGVSYARAPSIRRPEAFGRKGGYPRDAEQHPGCRIPKGAPADGFAPCAYDGETVRRGARFNRGRIVFRPPGAHEIGGAALAPDAGGGRRYTESRG